MKSFSKCEQPMAAIETLTGARASSRTRGRTIRSLLTLTVTEQSVTNALQGRKQPALGVLNAALQFYCHNH